MNASSLPLVSVAVVTYRQKAFILQCLESILAQGYPNLQIVVADDCSDDGSRETIAEFASRYPGRLTLLHAERNLGVTGNQARALSACSGKYISWMAGDDIMLPGKIKAQVQLMEADPQCAVCYHDLEAFDDESGAILYRSNELDKPREGKMATLARYGAFNPATSNMVRASCSPLFDARIPVASDWLYYTECLAGGGTLKRIPQVLGRYRRHPNNVTRSKDRAPPRELLIDHLASCAILTGRYPELAHDLTYRASRLLVGQRWEDEGSNYRRWLKASLAMRISPGVVAAFLASILLGIKR